MDNKEQHEVYFMDRFTVPQKSLATFISRMNNNRLFVSKLPGYKRGEAFQTTDNHGNATIITIAVWQNEDFLKEAKQLVQTEHIRAGFDPMEFYKRLDIQMEREAFFGIH